ncbi:magnesium/cobalt transporter CorA [Hymenobacter tibetensis]|uniref:Magnesium transport protein CorA n=1 Tax=Hymenobacter tibetensis TaxID=497967 RepID=A0ABY4D6P6_9BACT|nr:magnesium/cobalt transporter CorA [Hymenobacter tibetensis]UOG76901.1 magnesium/cobalt transporter CorA [Hymenobacter tibetensis]
MDSPSLPPAQPAASPLPYDDQRPASIADRSATRLAREQQVGRRPGTLTVREGSLTPRLFLLSYDEQHCTEQEYTTYDELLADFQSHPELRHWIDVRGYNDLTLIQRFIDDFQLHPLQMEDVLNDHERAKVDVFDDNRLFLVSRMTEFTTLLEVDDDQLSLFTGPNYVITFQDDYNDCLDPVRHRIRSGFSQIKRKPPLYLAYAITDVVLDNYYPTMAAIGDYIEKLENRILEDRPDRRVLNRILRVKKDIVRFRQLVFPEREKIAEILRQPDEVVSEEMKMYFRDCYDHAIQALELAETYRESVSSLVDLFMSNQSNRMNEVMKVLTIISSIFIPLSFVAGVYGMNFSRENPDGTINRLNMPELYSPWGYLSVLALMALMVVGQLYYFYRKGWLTNR